jgi:hypothetical protein
MILTELWSRTQSPGAEIKLPLGAAIKICGSGSFLFTADLKNFYRKIMVAEEVFGKCHNFYPIT